MTKRHMFLNLAFLCTLGYRVLAQPTALFGDSEVQTRRGFFFRIKPYRTPSEHHFHLTKELYSLFPLIPENSAIGEVDSKPTE